MYNINHQSELAVTAIYYIGHMTERTIACIANGGPTWPFMGEPAWLGVRDDAPLRVPLRRVKSELKVCVCVKH